MCIFDRVGFNAIATSNNHAAILRHGLANGGQAFGLGAIQESAGVDDHHISIIIARRNFIAFGAQLGKDAFGINQILWATQLHQANFRDMFVHVGALAELGFEVKR